MSLPLGDGAAAPRGVAASVLAAYSAHVAALDVEQVGPVAESLAERLGQDGVLHVLGCGHSQLLALEAYYRAGAPAWVAPLIDSRLSPVGGLGCTFAERRPGLGAELVSRLAAPAMRARALLVISVSGRAAVPVEAARAGRDLGLLTIALIGGEPGNRLVGVVDHHLRSGVPPGDAAVDVGGTLMAPQSTVVGAVLLHALLAETEARRVQPAVVVSVNVDGGMARNQALLERYPHLAPV